MVIFLRRKEERKTKCEERTFSKQNYLNYPDPLETTRPPFFDLSMIRCRMCSEDCSSFCEGNDNCQCIECINYGPGREHPRPSTTPQPTSFVTPSPTVVDIPLMSAAPTSESWPGVDKSAAPTPGSWPGTPVECTPGDADSCYDQARRRFGIRIIKRIKFAAPRCVVRWCFAYGGRDRLRAHLRRRPQYLVFQRLLCDSLGRKCPGLEKSGPR